MAVTEINLPKLTEIGLSLRVQGNVALGNSSGLEGISSIGVFQSTPFEHCVSIDTYGKRVVFEPSRYKEHQYASWQPAAVDRSRYSYPPATCVGDIDFSLVPGCPTCEQKWRESATRTDLGWCNWEWGQAEKHCGFSAMPPRGERLTCVTEGNSDGGDDGGGSPGSASLAIIIPVVIAAVLLVAAILFLVRKRIVAARQHRRESMPTVGGDDEAETEAEA